MLCVSTKEAVRSQTGAPHVLVFYTINTSNTYLLYKLPHIDFGLQQLHLCCPPSKVAGAHRKKSINCTDQIHIYPILLFHFVSIPSQYSCPIDCPVQYSHNTCGGILSWSPGRRCEINCVKGPVPCTPRVQEDSRLIQVSPIKVESTLAAGVMWLPVRQIPESMLAALRFKCFRPILCGKARNDHLTSERAPGFSGLVQGLCRENTRGSSTRNCWLTTTGWRDPWSTTQPPSWWSWASPCCKSSTWWGRSNSSTV